MRTAGGNQRWTQLQLPLWTERARLDVCSRGPFCRQNQAVSHCYCRCAEACSLAFIITWAQYPRVPGGLEDREDLVDNTNGWMIQEGGSHQNIVPKLAQRNVSPPCLPVDKTSFADVKLA